MEKKNTWETYSEEQLAQLEKLNAEYRSFLDNGKTERECIDTIVNTIEAEGYQELEKLIADVQKKMQKAAADLNFEAAAELRDKMLELKKNLNELEETSGGQNS